MEATISVPVYQEYMNPVLHVLRDHPEGLSIDELDRRVIEHMQLPPEIVAVPQDPEKPDRTQVGYRIAWARTYLRKAGFVDNPARGVWTLTEKGRAVGIVDAYDVSAEVAQAARGVLKDEEVGDAIEEDERTSELFAANVRDELRRALLETYQKLSAEGALLSAEDASRCYQTFRDQFGPEVLGSLDGEALLDKMHKRGTKDSLVYWLEFKDDAEFPARFGSISGGSAAKFGLFYAADSAQWVTHAGSQQTRLTIAEAVAKARAQRDQLLAATQVLASMAADPESIDYEALQTAVVAAAPDIAESSWVHKYLSLLFPTVLEPIHGEEYQAHQLRKLLKLPGSGRYSNARVFVGVAKQLGITLLDLAITLHRRNGGPHAYWRVRTTVDGENAWEKMRAGGFIAVRWPAVGDLTAVTHDQAGKRSLRSSVEQHYADQVPSMAKLSNQLFQFLTAAERDLVLAMDGARVRGIGRLLGPYAYHAEDSDWPHQRPVEWLSDVEWVVPEPEGVPTPFVRLRKPVNMIETEARLLGTRAMRSGPPRAATTTTPPLAPLTGIVSRVNAVLQRKRQVILFGPPGTGKTFWAERAAEELAARAWFGIEAARMDDQQRRALRDKGVIELCSFHAAYGYEDFLEGFRPTNAGGGLSFVIRDGIFKTVCARAAADPSRPYFLIIDEINRGDIPRIFGELLTVLEREKRGKMIVLPISGTRFSVPDNVLVLATMNTADRSIALLDAALRRRFGFVELMPDSTTLRGVAVGGLPLGPWLDELNQRVIRRLGRDARHLQIGHSYLLPGGSPVRELTRFVEILRDDIVPLLEEYCYDDFEALVDILGPTIAQASKQLLDTSLFEVDRQDKLMDALLSQYANVTATRAAVEAEHASAAERVDDAEERS